MSDTEQDESKPKPREYTAEEIAEIAHRVEQYSDHTPTYSPQRMLSPEFQGTSNYEGGIRKVRQETVARLTELQSQPDSDTALMRRMTEDLKTLDHLYENYHIGMNVFRTAHGGRSKLRK